MTAQLASLKTQRESALATADRIVRTAENAGHRALTASEKQKYDAALAEAETLNGQIKRVTDISTARALTPAYSDTEGARRDRVSIPAKLTHAYKSAFHHLLRSGNTSAGLYEGSDSAGGFAMPVLVDGEIVPLAPEDFAVRSLATVIPTVGDLKIPIQATKGTATTKAESGGSNNAFTDTSQTLTRKTLSAYQIGGSVDSSLELAEDTAAVDGLITPDLSDAVQEVEDNLFVNGTGVNEPEGVLTGADFGVANEDMDLDRILDLIGTLKARYLRNATFLMNRMTGIIIRKGQLSASIASPVWTRDADGTERLYGYPVAYSEAMPDVAQGNTPLVFGDFKRGVVIGDRGGSSIGVKILDQSKAVYGLIEVLAYRRTDCRVRRSEALKTFVIDSSS